MLTTTGSLASTVGKYNPFRYRSYYYDTETGWYYLQSRYYDPTVCRFLNADAIIGANGGFVGFNIFAYCNNNPVAFYDPSGMFCEICYQNELCGLDEKHICTDSLDYSNGSTYNAWWEQYPSNTSGDPVYDYNITLEANDTNVLDELNGALGDAVANSGFGDNASCFEITPPSISLTDKGLTVTIAQHEIKGETYSYGPFECSPYDCAYVNIGAYFGVEGVNISGIISAYSPTLLKVDCGDFNIEIGAEIGSIGGQYEFSWTEGFRFKQSALVGFDVSITWD